MIDFKEAVSRVIASVSPLTAETVPLERADTRILAADVKTRFDLPRFDQSAMDGYAVRLDDTREASSRPVTLRLTGEMPAGCGRRLPLRAGCAVKVFTGSMTPRDTEAVVMKEYVLESGDEIVVQRTPAPAEHIRRRGGELKRGSLLLAEGQAVTPPVMGLLAANGIETVRVYRQPDVGLLVLGDEIVPSGTPLRAGQIRDANGPALTALLKTAGVGRLRRSRVGDDPKALRRAMAREIKRCDVVVTVGGASVGDHDHVEAVRRQLGVRESFNRVAMKPGKPNIFGVAPGGCLVFGLPGNPVSALVSCEFFVVPAIERLRGGVFKAPVYTKAILTEPISRTSTRLEWVRAIKGGDGDETRVTPVTGQESHMLSGLAIANCLIEVPRGVKHVPAGAAVLLCDVSW